MKVRALARDIWDGWRRHPGRLAPVVVALLGGMAALMLLWAALSALGGQADRLAAGLGADGLMAEVSGEGAGWTAEQVGALRDGLSGWAAVCGMTEVRTPDGGLPVAGVEGTLGAVRGGWRWTGRAPDAADDSPASPGNVCWLEAGAASRMGAAVGDVVVLDGRPCAVAGLYDTCGGWIPGLPADVAFVPIRQVARGAELPRVRRALVRAAEGRSAEEVERRLRASLDAPWAQTAAVDGLAVPVAVLTPEMLLREVRAWQRLVRWAGGLAAGLALGLAAVTLACIQLLGVRERRAEIGLRRALGATRGAVAALFFAESMGLALVAALAAAGALHLMAPRLVAWMPVPLDFTPWTWIGPLGVATALAGLCAALPAHAAAGVEPAIGVRE